MELALELTTRRSDVAASGRSIFAVTRSPCITPRTTARCSLQLAPSCALLSKRGRSEASDVSRDPRRSAALGEGARRRFRSWCDAAGLPKHCSLHGLRKGGAWRLAEAGPAAKEIMGQGGHKTLTQVQRYIDAADRVKLAEQGSAKLRKRRMR